MRSSPGRSAPVFGSTRPIARSSTMLPAASWSHSVRTRAAASSGPRFHVVGVRGRAPAARTPGASVFGLDGVQLADEDAVRVGGGLLEELEAAGLVVAAEVVAARDDRGAAVAVAVAGVDVLGEAAQLAALGVVPAVPRVVVRGPRPLVAVALDGGPAPTTAATGGVLDHGAPAAASSAASCAAGGSAWSRGSRGHSPAPAGARGAHDRASDQ
jgi:hypothetical protein